MVASGWNYFHWRLHFVKRKILILSFNSLSEKFEQNFNFLHCYSIVSPIPPSWRKLLLSNKLLQSVFCDPITDELTCKAV